MHVSNETSLLPMRYACVQQALDRCKHKCMYQCSCNRHGMFPQQLQVGITFGLCSVHNNIHVFSLNTKNCASIVCRSSSITTTVPTKCAQLHPFRLQYPQCHEYVHPVSNKKCMCPMKPACFQCDMHVSNRHWTDASINASTNVHVRGIACFRSNCMFALHSICIACRKYT